MNEEKITGTLQVTGTINGTITIGGGSAPVLEEITVRSNANEQQVITPPEGVDGFSKVIVKKRPLTTKVIKPQTVAQTYSAWNEDYYGYSSVTVGAVNLLSKQVTPSSVQQVVTPDINWDGLSEVTVAGAPLQTKSVTPGATAQTVTADSGYYGLGSVEVDAMKIDLVINPQGGTAPTAINDYLFAGQENLRSVKINNALSADGVTVGSYAFAGCTSLERIEMPKVEQIKSYAFRYCPVKDYYFGSNGQGGVPTLSTLLPGTDDKRIHVPASLEADYKAASGWSQYASIIVGDYNA